MTSKKLRILLSEIAEVSCQKADQLIKGQELTL